MEKGQFPALTLKDHTGLVKTHHATDEKDYKDHLSVGYTAEYAHQEFPKVLHKAGGKSKTVANGDELAKGLAEGFSETPVIEE
jgi:hypothetical protein